jgi:hypothetical protein
VTSELAEKLAATRASTGYKGPAIVDTENVLVEELKKRGWLDVAITEKKGYANGMAQPAVLAVKKDGEMLYKWAIVPALVSLWSNLLPANGVFGDGFPPIPENIYVKRRHI